MLLAAFEALIEHEDARLTVIGADRAEVARYLTDPETHERIEPLGKVGSDELWSRLHEADLLCAPSLAGESFGMVLTEAFAAGTPVLASNIAGYADVVSDGHDGILVPPADPQRLAEELQSLSRSPERLKRMGEAARESAQRYAWPRVAAEVEGVYERAVSVPAPATARERLARVTGFNPGDGKPRVPARRLPSLDPAPARADRYRTARRIGLGVAALVGAGLTFIAAERIGVDRVVTSIVRSDITWVLVATALMISSMFLRASSWYTIAKAALPRRPLRRRDVASATMVGVLMSATLPARLGEPARAMVLARRTGRMRETFPVLLGTLVSQSVLNIAALVLLGVVIVSATDLFHSSSERLFLFSFAPLILLIAVVLAPTVVRQSGSGRIARVLAAIRDALLKVRTGLGRLPRPAPWPDRGADPARRVGTAAARLRRAVHGARARRPRRDRGRRRGPVRGQRHRGDPGDAVEHRRLPAGDDQRPDHRLRCLDRRRARLRRHPAGGRDRDRGHPRPSGPGPRGRHLAGHAPARALGRARFACVPPAAENATEQRLDTVAALSWR